MRDDVGITARQVGFTLGKQSYNSTLAVCRWVLLSGSRGVRCCVSGAFSELIQEREPATIPRALYFRQRLFQVLIAQD